MARYCLDSNVFIQAKNGPYRFDIFPVFWDWLSNQIQSGNALSSIEVYNEILEGEDELSDWIKEIDKFGFLYPDELVQTQYAEIANYVTENYLDQKYITSFLQKADGWIIALAKTQNLTVVTHEKKVDTQSNKIKIPNICEAFEVRYCNVYQMMRELGAVFTS